MMRPGGDGDGGGDGRRFSYRRSVKRWSLRTKDFARIRPRDRSVLIGADDLAAGLGGDGPPGRQRDGILDELDGAVEEADVHAARVVRLGVDHRDVVVA